MTMKIISFGVAKEITGALFIDFDAGENPVSIAELKENLFIRYPGLKKLSTLSVAVNSEYGTNETMVTNEDEVALIPPVSGG
jgi:molybdopterin converting factor small subunit